MHRNKAEEIKNVVTWHYEINSFTPCAKEEEGKFYSIVSDYLGTPTHAFDENGKKVWERQIDCYGRLRSGDNNFVPFLYLGQYVDGETGLAYNRFRYYDVESGRYMSQDPIGLAGGMSLYGYVVDINTWIDLLGLSKGLPSGFKSAGQLNQFGSQVQASVAKAGYGKSKIILQGSAVTGRSFRTGQPFDLGRKSDFDVAIVNSDLLQKAESLGLSKPGRGKSIPLDKIELTNQLGLGSLQESLSRKMGRDVNFRIFESDELAIGASKSRIIKYV